MAEPMGAEEADEAKAEQQEAEEAEEAKAEQQEAEEAVSVADTSKVITG